MAELDLSPAARADLVDIRLYSIKQFGANVADAYFHGFDEAFALLRQHPKVGPEQKGLGQEIRCLVHRRHRIFYQIEDNLVVIVRILHHAMNAKRMLKGSMK
jgi:toxin ParE1/3/4